MATATETVQSVFARWKSDIAPAWEDGTYTPNEDQFAEMAVEAVEIALQQRGAEDLSTRVYDALMASGQRALADEYVESLSTVF